MTKEPEFFNLPEPHATFLRNALDCLKKDERLAGIAAGGSYVTRSLDQFSDLDLLIAVEPAEYESVMSERQVIARGLGSLHAAFTGEHVGEPRLLICLYSSPLLHVDLKFIRLSDTATRVEEPVVLWERDGRFSEALKTGTRQGNGVHTCDVQCSVVRSRPSRCGRSLPEAPPAAGRRECELPSFRGRSRDGVSGRSGSRSRFGSRSQGSEVNVGITTGPSLMPARGNMRAGFALMREEGIADDTSTRST